MPERHKSIIAVYLILREGPKTLLLQRANTGYRDGQYGLPAGHVDAGEPIIDAMVREAKEEINIDIHSDHLQLVHVRDRNADDGHRVDFFFTCSKWHGRPENAEPHKCSDLTWHDHRDEQLDIIPYIKEVLNHTDTREIYSLEDWK